MTFIWMDMLWLLLLLPLLVGLYLWMLRRRRRTALRYASLAMVKQALGRGPGWRRHVPPALLLIALGVLIAAMARPAAEVTLASSRATIILAMDVSGSMRANDVEPSRIVAAQNAAKAFIAGQEPQVQIGIVTFAAIAQLVQVPTTDRPALNAAIDRFDLWRGTAVGSGLLVALGTIFPEENFNAGPGRNARIPWGGGPAFVPPTGGPESRSLDEPPGNAASHIPVAAGSYENAVIILLTDGATTTGPDPIAAGRLAADYGVRVFTVGFGAPEGAVVDLYGRSMRAQPDIETLRTIADLTHGRFFEAHSADELQDVYRSLSTQLVAETRQAEIAFVFAGIGALFALMAAGLSMLWFGRIT